MAPLQTLVAFFFFLSWVLLALAPQASTPAFDSLTLEQAKSLIRKGQTNLAEGDVRQHIKENPSSADGHFLLGYILFLEARAKESLAEYTEGAKYRKPSATDLKVVASDYVVLSDFPDADKWFTRVVEWTPNDKQAWYDLGRTKYNENRFEEAVDAFHRSLQLDPADVKSEDNLGLSYAALGRNDEAAAAFQRAIAMQETTVTKNSGPFLNLGSLLLDLNKTDVAVPLLTKALEISPRDFQPHRELGKAYARLNQLEKAAAEFEKAIDAAPRLAPLHFMLAQVYRKQGFAEKAKVELDRYSALK